MLSFFLVGRTIIENRKSKGETILTDGWDGRVRRRGLPETLLALLPWAPLDPAPHVIT